MIFRLIVMSALVWLFAIAAGRRRLWCYWGAILRAALVAYPLYYLSYLMTLDPTPLSWVREVALHGCGGLLWGYLYWRHGLAASIVGHVSAHLSLQPLLGFLFG
ncbi:hypothetical protein SAMN05216337_10743 [Bradyrhizobium brasilense]|uniref:CPBP family intramembrane metalloprotease n=1 Tax=Bradyrhizobium brasilense TaxID=1419277 RepID=A0A1G7NYU5_9BRAD|nr:hypothetical protein [Bradyrhizobium brasilense]SDF79225.1 hypothetical protein SAMN05216337_10743 [Bradyrhizobium brasilense]